MNMKRMTSFSLPQIETSPFDEQRKEREQGEKQNAFMWVNKGN